MPSYIGITVGPIVETISNAKSTGQLWGSSYLFSYIMKTLTNRLIQDLKIKDKIVFPSVDDRILKSGNEIGMFPDRLVFEGDSKCFGTIELARKDIILDIAKDIQVSKEECKEYKEFVSHAYEYVSQSITINYGMVECEKQEAIAEAFRMLDCLELRESFNSQYSEDLIQRYISNGNIKKSILMRDAFEKDEDNTPQNDSNYLLNGDSFRSIEKICGKKSNLPNKYKNYFAIIVADGDNIGTINKNMKGDTEKLDKLSKDMIDFSLSMHKIVKTYNAITIYAGGDDLFILSPIGDNGKTIFDMIEEIKIKYKDTVSKNIEDKYKKDKDGSDLKTSISFGVAMYYYKYPLKEVINSALNQLFGIAKKTKGKDCLAVRLQKHSGQSHECVFEDITEDSNFDEFKDLANPKENLSLKNFMYTLEKNKVFLCKVFEDDNYSVDNIADNLFDEPIHQGNNLKYIKRILTLIKIEYNKNFININDVDKEDKRDMAFYQALSVIRIIKYMHEEDVDGGDSNE